MFTDNDIRACLNETVANKAEETKKIINTQNKKLSLLKHFLKTYDHIPLTVKMGYVSFLFSTDLPLPFMDYSKSKIVYRAGPADDAFAIVLINSFDYELECFSIEDSTIDAVFDDGMLEIWLRAQSISWESVNEATNINFKNILKATIWLRFDWLLKTTNVDRILKGVTYVNGEYKPKSPFEMAYSNGSSASVYARFPLTTDQYRWQDPNKQVTEWGDDTLLNALTPLLNLAYSKSKATFIEKCTEIQSGWLSAETLEGIEGRAFEVEGTKIMLTSLMADYDQRNIFPLELPLIRLADEYGFRGIDAEAVLKQVPQATSSETNRILAMAYIEAILGMRTGACILQDRLREQGMVKRHASVIDKLGDTAVTVNNISVMFLLCLELKSFNR